jgi:hypothetical protein
LITGARAFYHDDQLLAAELPVYDALYAWCRRKEALATEPRR